MIAGLLFAAALIGMVALLMERAGTVGPIRETSLAWSPEAHAAQTDIVGPVAHEFRVLLDSLQTVVAANPDGADVRLALARALHDAHMLPEAIAHYEILVAAEPGVTAMHLDLAQAHAQLEQWEQAGGIMERLLEQDPENAAVLYNLGAIAANRGDPTAAGKWWNRMLDLEGDSVFDERARMSLRQLEDGRRDGS